MNNKPTHAYFTTSSSQKQEEEDFMQNLRVIENDLVPVYETSTGEKVVYGTELHEILGAPSVYREWVKRRLNDVDAVENEDFEGVEISTPSRQSRLEHIIKLDTAKEMAMPHIITKEGIYLWTVL